jgi:two-component system OmpR family sensor kinase
MTKERKAISSGGTDSTGGGFFSDIDVEFLVHELKTPLSIVDTALHMLLKKPDRYGPLMDRQRKILERALRNSRKARHLLAHLLEVGRSGAGCIECCQFKPLAVVDDVLMEAVEASDAERWEALEWAGSAPNREAVLSRYGVRINCTDDARCVQLVQDETKFRQILANLINNAIQHRHRWLELGIDCRDEWLIIDVGDDGPGVEKENREVIFERYTRLKSAEPISRSGHGLGLAGARILARHLGGDITVRDNRIQGATFRLTLPLNFDNCSSCREDSLS